MNDQLDNLTLDWQIQFRAKELHTILERVRVEFFQNTPTNEAGNMNPIMGEVDALLDEIGEKPDEV